MNHLLRLKKSHYIVQNMCLEDLLYCTLISDISKRTYKVDENYSIDYAVFAKGRDIADYFPDWEDEEINDALKVLEDRGVINLEKDDILLGTYHGTTATLFAPKSNLFESAKNKMESVIRDSDIRHSRISYIKERIDMLLHKDIETWKSGDFIELHSYLYEVYTGGEVYQLRNNVEKFQPSNMLKAYSRSVTFALIVEGTLNYNEYRRKGVPTLTNVACVKDDVFGELTKRDKGSKGYMREVSSAISNNHRF